MVYASSAAVYGNNEALPLSEAEVPQPLTAYGADKLGCELHARVGAEVHGIPGVGLRFFNVYGPRQDPSSPYSGVVSIFNRLISEGKPVTIYGDGRQSRDFVYVGDVVSALQAAMQKLHAAKEIICDVSNVCRGESLSLLELIDTLEDICDRKVERIFAAERTGDIRHSQGDPQHMHEMLNVICHTLPRQGLERLTDDQ